MKLSADYGHYGTVSDAHGHLIPYPITVDTETGECECAVYDPNSLAIQYEYDKGEMMRVALWYQPPLTFEAGEPDGKYLDMPTLLLKHTIAKDLR